MKRICVKGVVVLVAATTVFAAGCAGAAGTGTDNGKLLEQLASRYVGERQAAVAAAVKLPAGQQVRLVPGLVKLIEASGKDAWFGQESAARVLVAMGPRAKAAAPVLSKRLLAALKDKDWGLCDVLSAALGKVDVKAAQAIVPQVIAMLDGEDRQAQRLAIIVLGNVGPAAEGVVPALSKMVAGTAHSHLRREAARALSSVGPGAKAAVPSLTAALKSGDAVLAGLAVDALGAVGPGAVSAVPQLAPFLKHGDASLRARAAKALAGIGPASVPAFKAVLKEKGKGVDPAIVDAIGGLGKAAQAATPELLAAAKGATPDLIGRIDAALKKVKAKNAVPAVEDVTATCAEGRSVTIVLPATDEDDVAAAVKAVIVRQPRHATLEQQERTTFVFRSKPGFAGDDKFTWKATDGVGDSKTATAVVTVTPDKEPPRLVKAVSDSHRTHIKIVYDERVSAPNKADYAIDNNVAIKSAKFGEDGTSVVLEVSALKQGVAYTLTAKDIRDVSKARNVGGGTTKVLFEAPGLRYAFYRGVFPDFPDYAKLKPTQAGVSETVKIINPGNRPQFALTFEGMIKVPADGEYTFFTVSDDGTRLFIGDKKVVENGGTHGMTERAGKIPLKAGMHPFRVIFFDGGGGFGLRALWQGPGISKQDIPAAALFHIP